MQCPYCGQYNSDGATQCRKCDAPFGSSATAVYKAKAHLAGPEKAHSVRSRALLAVALGLLMKVYWGGFWPWPVFDNPTLAGVRGWLEPLLLFGGCALYVIGWLLNWI